MAHATAPTAEPDPGDGGGSLPPAWMAVDWRRHQRWLQVDGRWANVVELGDGPPILFVHGLSGCWQNWLIQLTELAASHRVIAVDLPGFGASELPAREISIPGYAVFLDRVCDLLGVEEPLTVVGNSMGGFVAAELAIAVPERVDRLVLVSAAGVSINRLRRQPTLTVARGIGVVTAWAVSRHETLARRPRLRRAALQFAIRHPERLSAPLAFELMSGSGRAGFVPALAACIGHPIRDRLAQIACPTLIVWGEDDRVIPVKDAGRFERLIPGARAVVLPDTGHVAMIERPVLFNGLLERFLSE
jgi:pimeloyl-ACP methyl ester carboxylesterase